MRTKRGLVACGASVAVLALVAAGCGGEPFPQSKAAPVVTLPGGAASNTPQARLLAAVQRATATKTARLALSMSVTGIGQGAALALSGSGLVDFERDRLVMHLQGESGGVSRTAEVRIVDATAYANDGTGWKSAPYELTSANNALDPSTFLEFLRGVSTDVRVEGNETLRGARTTRYGATVDLERAVGSSPNATQRPALQSALRTFGDLEIPSTVWLDDQGRVRKLQMSLDLSAFASRNGSPPGLLPRIELTFEFYDFGTPVDVQVPAGAKTVATVARERATQADLRNALTAAKVSYTDTGAYPADAATLQQIEPSLDWGGSLRYVVADDGQSICLSERASTGESFALFDAAGAQGATSYGRSACPAVIGDTPPPGFGPSW